MTEISSSFPLHVQAIDTYYSNDNMAASHLIIEKDEALFIDVGTSPACGLLLKGLARQGLPPPSSPMR